MGARTAQWARMLDAAAADLKPMPASYSGMEREWLLGTLIGKIESAVMFRNIGMDDKADQLLAEAMAAIAASKAAPRSPPASPASIPKRRSDMTPAEQFRAVNAAMRPRPMPTIWDTRWTGLAIFAAAALLPFLACLGE